MATRVKLFMVTCVFELKVRLGYCFTPFQRLRLYNGAPLAAFYDMLGLRRTSSRLKPPGVLTGVFVLNVTLNDSIQVLSHIHLYPYIRILLHFGIRWKQILILNFSLPARSERVSGSHVNENKHDNSPVVCCFRLQIRFVYGVGSPTVGPTSSSVRLHVYVPSHI